MLYSLEVAMMESKSNTVFLASLCPVKNQIFSQYWYHVHPAQPLPLNPTYGCLDDGGTLTAYSFVHAGKQLRAQNLTWLWVNLWVITKKWKEQADNNCIATNDCFLPPPPLPPPPLTPSPPPSFSNAFPSTSWTWVSSFHCLFLIVVLSFSLIFEYLVSACPVML